MSKDPIVIIENKQRVEKTLQEGERLVVKRAGNDDSAISSTEQQRLVESFDPNTTAPIFVSSQHISKLHAELRKDDINIVLAPELATADAKTVLGSVLENGENDGRDMIGIIGSDAAKVADINAQVATNKRVVLTAPAVNGFACGGSGVPRPSSFTEGGAHG